MGVLELIQQKAFLGREFLTWLWFRAEIDGRIDLDDKPLEVEILGPIQLDAHYGDARATSLKGDSPATSPEARTALLEGKKMRKTKMKWTRGDGEWTFSLDAETFNLSGLAVPNPGRLPFEESITLRLDVVQEFEQLFARTFEKFLDLRLDAAQWEPELDRIQTWVREK